MKRRTFITLLAAATTLAAAMLCACGGKTADGNISTLDLEAAIDNPRAFDLAGISADIDFIPLDDSHKEGLVGNIRTLAATKERFYIHDNGRESVLKIFDIQGRFISTLGVYGRSSNEFMGLNQIAVDYDGDNLYLSGTMGNMKRTTMAVDASGKELFRSDSISGEKMAFFDGRLVVLKNSPAPFSLGNDPDFKSSIGTEVPFLEFWSPDLRHEGTVTTIDKGIGGAIIINTEGGQISNISVSKGSPAVITGNGASLLVKEPLGDTLYRYSSGKLAPAYKLYSGKYGAPAEAFGLNPSVPFGDSRFVQEIYEGDEHLFIAMSGSGGTENVMIVIDKKNPAEGFSATGGPERKPGLFIDGIAFIPCYIRDNRLVGYISALSIADNVENLTDPRLKTLAATLREDSNPVIVIATLK